MKSLPDGMCLGLWVWRQQMCEPEIRIQRDNSERNDMQTRKLGTLEVSSIGMGCMGFTPGYGACPDEKESIRLIRKAFDLGCTFFDTAEIYSAYGNELLVGKALNPIRDKVVLSSKVHPAILPGQNFPEGKMSRRGIFSALDGSLRRLQTDHLDLYYVHRVPEATDVEELAHVFGELIQDGKILGWGVSEATVEQIRKANAVTPLTAVQSEYSMMARQWEKDVIPLCAELGIGFVAYSPMASGFLSGKYTVDTEYKGDDVRRVITRFSKKNVMANQPLLDLLFKYAAEKHATPAQISLAWLMHRGDFIVPIPGMRRDERIKENLGAADVILTDEEFARLETELDKIIIHGDRKDEDIAKLGTIAICQENNTGTHL